MPGGSCSGKAGGSDDAVARGFAPPAMTQGTRQDVAGVLAVTLL